MEKQSTNLIFLAKHAIVEVSYHNCYQIIISIKNTFTSTINGVQKTGMKGLIINKGIKHSCSVMDACVIVYYIESDSLKGRILKDLIKNQQSIEIQQLISEQEGKHIYPIDNQIDSLLITDFANDILNEILPVQNLPTKQDERIKKVLTYIEENLHNTLTLDDLSSIAFLSSDRLRHLFTEEVGTAFSQYIIWKRINIIIREVVNGKRTMAEAAHHYGFSDQSHFSKLFKRMFGVPAKMMLKPSPYIQFLN